jgi:hypothetical protein
MKYLKRGSACELNIYGHEQYPFHTQAKIIRPMLFTNYPKLSIVFLVGLGNTPPSCNRYVMEPKSFFIYPNRGIAHPLGNFGHMQYPFNSLD